MDLRTSVQLATAVALLGCTAPTSVECPGLVEVSWGLVQPGEQVWLPLPDSEGTEVLESPTLGFFRVFPAPTGLRVTFRSPSAGSFSDTVRLQRGGCIWPVELRAQVRVVRAEPASLDFGVVDVGAWVEREVLVVADGAVVPVGASWLAGPDAPSFQVMTRGSAPGGAARFRVRFTPRGRDVQEATLRLSELGFSVPLRGVGGPLDLAEGCVEVPSRVDLGEAELGCAGPEQRVTVTNRCRVSVGVTVATPKAPGQAVVTDVSGLRDPLRPGQSAAFRLRLAPTLEGPMAETLALTLDQAGLRGGATVQAVGRALPRRLQVDEFTAPPPERLDLAVVIHPSAGFAEQREAVARSLSRDSEPAGRDVNVAVFDDSPGPEQGKPRGVVSRSTSDFSSRLLTLLTVDDATDGGSRCLETLRRLSERYVSGATDGGFPRQGFSFGALCISDQQDTSPGTVAESVTALRAVWPGLSISALRPAGCGEPSAPDVRLAEAVRLTGGSLDSCPRGVASAPRRVFPLSLMPHPDALPRVSIDGIDLEPFDRRGARVWEFSPADNAITFEYLYTPPASSTLRLSYQPECSDGR